MAGLEAANQAAAADAVGADGILIKGQVRYSITPSDERRRGSSIAAGYVRDFRSSFFTNFVQLNQLFADFQGRLGDVSPSVPATRCGSRTYDGEVTRKDIVNRVAADLKYTASDWASFTGRRVVAAAGVGLRERRV